MAKLFPPIIEGIVPAFYDNENGMINVVIPFSMNRAVSQAQVKGLAVKIKTVQSSNYLYTGKITDSLDFEMEDTCWVRLQVKKSEVAQMKTGQYYKFQIAYIGQDDIVGYYSTVGVGKYTTKPTIEIVGLTVGEINSHTYKYMGHYSQQDGDTAENEYSYRFDIYDDTNEIVYTTGDQLHNSSNDTELYESYDDFMYSSELPIDTPYRIKYTITTINGLTISSPRYRIMQKLTIDPEIAASLVATPNSDNGYVVISLIGEKQNNGLEEPATGAFLLTRACEDDDYTSWDEISRFKLAAQIPSMQLWEDFTIQQGKHYKYSLQQYNDNGLYSNRLYSNVIYGDFEDAFLFDGKRQLKIKYNPKVSSFKRDILETKIETIGSKHPFILRNGNVDYKEFPISGLISYYMDEENRFLTKEEFNPEATTNLTGTNIAQERDFKMKVYDWLTNGEPKLFRSPGEGNFIVRLMNVSLSPNDIVGRMLHTFSATAYEVAEHTYENLSSFGFIHLEDPEVAQLRFETIEFNDKDYHSGVVLNKHPIYTVRLTDLMPGDQLRLVFDNSTKDEQIITIGITGSYYVDLGVPIKGISFLAGTTPKGSMTYSYYSIQSNVFDKIDDVSINEVPNQQFIGEHDIIKEIEDIKYSNEWVKNPKIDLLEVYSIFAQKRSIEKVYYSEEKDKYYKDVDLQIGLGDDKDIFTLYTLGHWERPGDTTNVNIELYDRYNLKYVIDKYISFDINDNKTFFEPDEYQPYIWINGSQISVEDIQDISVSRFGKIESLVCGNGCMLDISYQKRTIDYSIEDNTSYNVYIQKKSYNVSLNKLKDFLSNKNAIENVDEFHKQEMEYRREVDTNYQSYIIALIKAQEEEKKAEGLA